MKSQCCHTRDHFHVVTPDYHVILWKFQVFTWWFSRNDVTASWFLRDNFQRYNVKLLCYFVSFKFSSDTFHVIKWNYLKISWQFWRERFCVFTYLRNASKGNVSNLHDSMKLYMELGLRHDETLNANKSSAWSLVLASVLLPSCSCCSRIVHWLKALPNSLIMLLDTPCSSQSHHKRHTTHTHNSSPV